MTDKLLSTGTAWSFELIEKYDREIARIAQGYRLDTYPNQIEIIRSDQMMDAYASVGMPIGYNHWSYGKQFLNVELVFDGRKYDDNAGPGNRPCLLWPQLIFQK